MRLPSRSPGAALPDVMPPPDRREALADLDTWQGRCEVAEAERDQLGKELDEVAAQRDEAEQERDDLSVRSLPMRDLPWFEAEPVPPLIGDELAERHGGWPE